MPTLPCWKGAASEGLAMWWDPYTSGWKQWNGGTCTNVAAAQDGSAYITNDCGAVYHSGGWAGGEDGMHASKSRPAAGYAGAGRPQACGNAAVGCECTLGPTQPTAG